MKLSLYIASGIFGVHALWVGIIERSDIPTLSFSAMIGLLFFANLERIKNIKVGGDGIEAETHEVIQNAREVTKEMKDLAHVLVENQITTIQRNMRMGGYTDKEKEERKDDLLQILRNIGSSEEQISRALKEWNLFEEFDYSLHLLNGSKVPVELGKEVLTDWHKLRDQLSLENPPSPTDIRSFLEKHSLLNPQIEERIKDYEYYIVHKKHRRPKDFAKRNEWRIKE